MARAKKPYMVQLTMEIRAETLEDAHDIVIGAAEHLVDTYNDDESIGSLFDVKSLGQKG